MTLQLGFWELFALISLGFVSSALALLGVWIGGYLVYKTRRDGTLFENPLARGGACQAQDEEEDFHFGSAQNSLFSAGGDEEGEPPDGADVDRILRDRAKASERLKAQIMGMAK